MHQLVQIMCMVGNMKYKESYIYEYMENQKMESQKQVEKKYNKLLKEVETNTFYSMDLTNRINCYVCDCGHVTKTLIS